MIHQTLLGRVHPATLVWLAGVVAALHIGKLPPAIPLLREALGVSLVQAGFLLSTVQVAGMLAGAVMGLLADSLGLRRSMLAGLVLLALASLAGAWAASAGVLLALRAAEGMGVLMTVLPAPSLIRRLVTPQHLPARLGLWGAYMPTGTSVALLVGPLVLAGMGWQGWWQLLGWLAAAMAAWVLVSVPPDAPRQSPGSAPRLGPLRLGLQRLGQTLGSAGPWLVALCFGLYSSQWLAVVGFLPSVYAQAGVVAQWAGALTAVVCAANVVGNVAAGRLLQRGVGVRVLLTVGYCVMAVAAWLAFSTQTEGWPLLRYGAVVLFSAVGGVLPGTLFSLAVRVAPSESTVSTTVGWVQQCSSTGQFVGPPLVAWVAAQVGGWHATWWVIVAECLLGSLVVVLGITERSLCNEVHASSH